MQIENNGYCVNNSAIQTTRAAPPNSLWERVSTATSGSWGNFAREATFSVSYCYNIAMGQAGFFDVFNEIGTIEGKKLFLSRMLLETENNILKKEGIKLVASFAEDFEVDNKTMPVLSDETIKTKGARRIRYSTKDFNRPSKESLLTPDCVQISLGK